MLKNSHSINTTSVFLSASSSLASESGCDGLRVKLLFSVYVELNQPLILVL